MKAYKRSTQAVGLVAVIGAAVAVGVMVMSDPQKTPFVIAAGALGSFIVALLMLIVNAVVLGDAADEAIETVRALRDRLHRLDDVTTLLRGSKEHGIRDVRPKGHYSTEDWCRVLAEANDEFIIVGHALDKWCTDRVNPQLAEAVRRVVANGGRVRLLTLSESNSRVPALRKKEYEDRIRTSLSTFARIEASLPASRTGSFEVYHLSDSAEMHYMAVVTERVVITAPYPAAKQDSDPVPAVTVDASSEIADLIRADLDLMFKDNARRVSLAGYGGGPSS